jgi:GT2 family glycosyltransferase
VWGSPSLQWRRTFGEAVRFVVRAVRHYGLEGSIARARAHGSVNTSEPHKVYRQWLAAHAPNQTALDRMHAASRALPVQPRFALFVRAPHSSSDLVARTVASLERQAYPEWDLWLWRGGSGPVDVGFDHVVTGSDSEADARTTVASTSTADFIATIEAGDELAPEALFEIASAIAREPRADLVYSDEDRVLADGPGDPTFKPGWSPEYLLARFYLGGLLAIRRQAILDASGYRAACDGAHDYDVALRTTARGARVLHVPKMLYHRMAFRATNADAERVALEDVCRTTARDALVLPGAFPGTWRVKHRVPDAAVVTIVIPTAARVGPTVAGLQPLVLQTIESIVQRTSYTRYELLIADNGALPVAVTRALSGVPHRVVTFRPEGRFNFSGIVNFGVSHVTTDYVLLLNDDIEVINADWLTAMLEYATQEAIGAVGPKLFYPDGRLQHVGVATGVGGIAAHLLHQQPGGSTGCGEMAFTVRNCSAVTAACLLTRREIFERVGGFDERFAIDFNDVDFCLKVRAAGYRIVFTPYAKLYHHESASFGSRLQHAQEIEAMREIWGSALEADPYYNPNLSRDFSDCRVADPA